MNFNLSFTSYTKINTKWITNLNVKSKTVNFLEKIRENYRDLELYNESLDLTPKARSIKKK